MVRVDKLCGRTTNNTENGWNALDEKKLLTRNNIRKKSKLCWRCLVSSSCEMCLFIVLPALLQSLRENKEGKQSKQPLHIRSVFVCQVENSQTRETVFSFIAFSVSVSPYSNTIPWIALESREMAREDTLLFLGRFEGLSSRSGGFLTIPGHLLSKKVSRTHTRN